MENASFTLVKYEFNEIELHLPKSNECQLELNFDPSGVYKKGTYRLKFIFIASKKDNVVVKVECNAEFKFLKELSFQEIPPYFYPNSIAIIFPYIRAMVSTLTLQANISPIVLPTMNLTTLQKTLQDKTIVED